MRLTLLLVLSAALLSSCTSSRIAREPADLIGRGRNVSALAELGWVIAPPVSASSAAAQSGLSADSQASDGSLPWSLFVSRLAAGDELRPLRNNAGTGYGIFRGGTLVDLYLVTVF